MRKPADQDVKNVLNKLSYPRGKHVNCFGSSSYNRCIHSGSHRFLVAKGYIEDYIENAAYAKSVTHPEMFDEEGNMIHDELIYVRPPSPWDHIHDTEDEED